jgi:hypothetical protein
MKYGICLQSFITVRYSQTDKSEMTSQLLFGETYTVLEQGKDWLRIICAFDNYAGWIDKVSAHSLSEESFVKINQCPQVTLDRKIIKLTFGKKTCITILPGSDLPFYNPSVNGLEIDKNKFILKDRPETGAEKATDESLMHTAEAFINVSYLWGGRSLYGIDCSGLTQVVFKINHIKIPRDVSQQVFSGKVIDRLEDAKQGDLAFFSNEEGNVSHVGILMSDNKILHASGYVRMDRLDAKGIFHSEKQIYTHRLYCLRRLL